MSGRRFPRSGALGLALAAMVLASSAGCVDRETSNDTGDAGPMHPPELLAARDEACEDYCDARMRCGLADEGDSCSCEVATFDNKHQLCVEKSIAKLECLASTSCELLAHRLDLPPQDRPCYGEGIAEAVACRPL